MAQATKSIKCEVVEPVMKLICNYNPQFLLTSYCSNSDAPGIYKKL